MVKILWQKVSSRFFVGACLYVCYNAFYFFFSKIRWQAVASRCFVGARAIVAIILSNFLAKMASGCIQIDHRSVLQRITAIHATCRRHDFIFWRRYPLISWTAVRHWKRRLHSFEVVWKASDVRTRWQELQRVRTAKFYTDYVYSLFSGSRTVEDWKRE